MTKSDDAENRLQQNNVILLGLPEGALGDHPTEFAEKDIFDQQSVSPTYVVEGVHSVPMGHQTDGTPHCHFL